MVTIKCKGRFAKSFIERYFNEGMCVTNLHNHKRVKIICIKWYYEGGMGNCKHKYSHLRNGVDFYV
jgi:hypothetical protein